MRRFLFFDLDIGLLLPVGILIILSLTTLFSINFSLFKSQVIFLLIGIIFFIFFANSDYKILQLYSIPIYLVSLGILFFVLILGIESRGAVRWVDIFGLRIQFSEILKPFLLVSISSYLAGSKGFSLKEFTKIIMFILPIVFLILKQPDLGSALIYLLVAIFILLTAGFPFTRFLLFGFLTGAAVPLFWRFLHEYQRQRIFTFLNPTSDPLGTSYNAIQSIIAVGSGMLFGRGLWGGTQSTLKFLPERHTDFIFATLSEQFGFLVSFGILVCFFLLLLRIYSIFCDSKEKFCRIFSAGAFFLILVQLSVNIGMNVGLLPVVGVTLPFVSYGGSSLLSSFILLGFLTSISRDFKNKEVLEIR
ncbi:MAG: FtsW/RodA/SpoVE family cell cycle protein [bacterium]|nr:FtsW/RodA/SpoVE family cell cycle protein [bacterium]